VVGLARVEQYARSRGLDQIDLDSVPKGFDYFVGQAVSTAQAGKGRTLRSVD
jgi:hypothetical protein